MTNHRAGKTNTRDPRGGWRIGKRHKKTRRHRHDQTLTSTVRYIRRTVKAALKRGIDV